MTRAWNLVLFAALAAMATTGCATYTDSVRDAQTDVRSGQPGAALEHFNEPLGTKSWKELPPDLGDNRTLLLLERATLLQATERYETSARDMVIADQRLEWLDISAYDRVDLARWLYSDDARDYRAPAYERLLLNSINMINFMAMGDLEGARVEARRFELIEGFFVEESAEPIRGDIRALGHYLSGATFEHSGDLREALRHYEIAWDNGFRDAELGGRIIDLYRISSTSPGRSEAADDSGRAKLMEQAAQRGSLRPSEYRRQHLEGDTIVVIQSGLAPYRKPARVPIGRAFVWAGAARSTYALSSAERMRGEELVAQGLLKWVNLPLLTDDGIQIDPSVALRVNGDPIPFDSKVDVAAQVVESWQALFPPIVASAIARMMTRALAGGATRVASKEVMKNADSTGAMAVGAVGLLASLAIEGGMAAADTPDTRSWTTLPGTIRVTRGRLDPGVHQFAVGVRGSREERTVTISQKGLTLVNFSRLR